MANLDFDPHALPCDVVRAAEGIIRAEERRRLLAEEWAPYQREHQHDHSSAMWACSIAVAATILVLAVLVPLAAWKVGLLP